MTTNLKELFDFVREGNLPLFKEKFEKGGFDVNEYEPGGTEFNRFTLLGLCCKKNLVEFVKVLLCDENLDVNKFFGDTIVTKEDEKQKTIMKTTFQDTPLCYCCKFNRYEIVRMLVQHPKIVVKEYYKKRTNDECIKILLRDSKRYGKNKFFGGKKIPESREEMLMEEVKILSDVQENESTTSKYEQIKTEFSKNMTGLYEWNGKPLLIVGSEFVLYDGRWCGSAEVVSKNIFTVDFGDEIGEKIIVKCEDGMNVFSTVGEQKFIDESNGVYQSMLKDEENQDVQICQTLEQGRVDLMKIQGRYDWDGRILKVEKNHVIVGKNEVGFEKISDTSILTTHKMEDFLMLIQWCSEDQMLRMFSVDESRPQRLENKLDKEERKIGCGKYDFNGFPLEINGEDKSVTYKNQRYECEVLEDNLFLTEPMNNDDDQVFVFWLDKDDHSLRVIRVVGDKKGLYYHSLEQLDPVEKGDISSALRDYNWMGKRLSIRKNFMYFDKKRYAYEKLSPEARGSGNVVRAKIMDTEYFFMWDVEDEMLRVCQIGEQLLQKEEKEEDEGEHEEEEEKVMVLEKDHNKLVKMQSMKEFMESKFKSADSESLKLVTLDKLKLEQEKEQCRKEIEISRMKLVKEIEMKEKAFELEKLKFEKEKQEILKEVELEKLKLEQMKERCVKEFALERMKLVEQNKKN